MDIKVQLNEHKKFFHMLIIIFLTAFSPEILRMLSFLPFVGRLFLLLSFFADSIVILLFMPTIMAQGMYTSTICCDDYPGISRYPFLLLNILFYTFIWYKLWKYFSKKKQTPAP